MDMARPFRAISPSIDVELLIELSRSQKPRSGRQLAKRIERSESGVRHALDQMIDHGLVLRQEAGRSYLYALNREHILAPAVELIAGARNELVERLRSQMADWQVKPVHASLFGSTARGDGDTESDIDVLVVRPNRIDIDDMFWRSQLDVLADAVLAWTGNHLGLAEVAQEQALQLQYEGRPIIEEVKRDAIELSGIGVRKLLRGVA